MALTPDPVAFHNRVYKLASFANIHGELAPSMTFVGHSTCKRTRFHIELLVAQWLGDANNMFMLSCFVGYFCS